MKVISTHFIVSVNHDFPQEFNELKKVHLLEDGSAIIETESKKTHYEHITAEEFAKLEATGLNTSKKLLS